MPESECFNLFLFKIQQSSQCILAEYICGKKNQCKYPLRDLFSNEYLEICRGAKAKILLKQKKTDIFFWTKAEKNSFTIHMVVLLDVYVTKNFNQKRDNYIPLATELKRLYENYTFKVILVAIGETDLVRNSLKLIMQENGVERNFKRGSYLKHWKILSIL